nr:MAG TPA: hypothetical protein [Caudoviricetes sp.]
MLKERVFQEILLMQLPHYYLHIILAQEMLIYLLMLLLM